MAKQNYEGSPLDRKQDKAGAKKKKESLKKWEGSAADKKQDAKLGFAKGGKVKKAK